MIWVNRILKASAVLVVAATVYGGVANAASAIDADVIHVTNPAPPTCAPLHRCAPVHIGWNHRSIRLGLKHTSHFGGHFYIDLRATRSGRLVFDVGTLMLPRGCAGRNAAVLDAYRGSPGGTIYEDVFACNRLYLIDVS